MDFYSLNINSITLEQEEHIKLSYPKRYNKALQYVNHEDYLRCIGSYLLLEQMFGEFNENDLIIKEKGKPSIKGKPFFNYSHSGDFVVAVQSDKNEVGIDIQLIGDKDSKFIKEWTIKEAISKMTGEGLKPHKNPTISNKYSCKTEIFNKNYVISIAYMSK